MMVAVATAAVAITVASTAATAASAPDVVLRRAKPMMGTIVTVTVRGPDPDALEHEVREAFREMERLASVLSEWSPDTPVSAVNRQAGVAPVPVPTELLDVLETAAQTSARTSGAFDVTWAALGDLWRFDEKPLRRVPTADEVERRRALVGYRRLVLDRAAGTAFLERTGMRIGLGGIAKGYIAEAAADLLVSVGVRDVLVAASGDIAARGSNGDRPWTVAIRDPRRPAAAIATVTLHDESISTSGDYERFAVIAGRRYHHIIDPRTGYPAAGTASVTVVARHGAEADALATGLFVLGAGRGAPVARGVPGCSALFVNADGRRHAIGDRFRITRDGRRVASGARVSGRAVERIPMRHASSARRIRATGVTARSL